MSAISGGGRGQAVPIPGGTTIPQDGYIYRNRVGFLTSNPAAKSPAFSSMWTNTASAVRLAGKWDSRANSADTTISMTVSYTMPGSPPWSTFSTGIGFPYLAAQYVMPSFSISDLFQQTWDYIQLLGLGAAAFSGAGPAFAVKFTQSGAAVQLTVGLIVLARIFSSADVLKYELSLSPTSAEAGLYVSQPTSSNFNGGPWLTTFSNGQAQFNPVTPGSFGLSAASGDYMVFEIGALFYPINSNSLSSGTVTGTLTFRFGDSYSVNNDGARSPSGYTPDFGITPANANLVLAFRAIA